jgi:hypothetical protein
MRISKERVVNIMCSSCERNKGNGGNCKGNRKNCSLMTEKNDKTIVPKRKIKNKGFKVNW